MIADPPGTLAVWRRRQLSVHLAPSLVLWIVLVTWIFSQRAADRIVVGLVVAIVSVLSILVHELGHATAVRRAGLGPAQIVLAGLRSTCSWRAASQPLQRLRVALAGPVASAVLGAAFVGAAAVARGMEASPAQALLWQASSVLALLNLGWAVTNLLPILPLDGGFVVLAWQEHRSADPDRAWQRTRWISYGVGAAVMLWLLWQTWYLPALFVGWFLATGTQGLGPTRSAPDDDHDAHDHDAHDDGPAPQGDANDDPQDDGPAPRNP